MVGERHTKFVSDMNSGFPNLLSHAKFRQPRPKPCGKTRYEKVVDLAKRRRVPRRPVGWYAPEPYGVRMLMDSLERRNHIETVSHIYSPYTL